MCSVNIIWHGDLACYETMVLMAPFSYYPIEGQGNWGFSMIRNHSYDALYRSQNYLAYSELLLSELGQGLVTGRITLMVR